MVDHTDLIYFFIVVSGWGFSTFIMGYIGKRITFETAMLYNTFGFAIVAVLTANKADHGLTLDHTFAIMNGASFALADLCYYLMSSRGMSVSTLGPLTSMYVVVPTVLGLGLLHEHISAKKLLGMTLAFVAMYVLAIAEHDDEDHAPKDDEERGRSLPPPSPTRSWTSMLNPFASRPINSERQK
eukprot:TRINITY_DN27070_c0_g1_i1.p1 TRINITY_DN27070_c0_g1~~TRINITY_DN27070_c0_g1_i1.p1  ORF type:complete len:184 (+),score=27.49 TRINITY_DN27070_c0_g1_i1:171-722(+)